AEVKPAETAKPKPTLPKGSAPKPAEVKPAETAKPKGTLPKGFEVKEAPKEAPKPAETTSQPPVTLQAALEDAYMNAAMTDFHQYRAKVTGYTPAPNRYFVRGYAPVGKIPTKNWNDQKATVTGYTQPSDQYFATRPRLAYHPPQKRFGTFSGVNMTVDGVVLKTTSKEAPKPQVSTEAPPQNYGGDDKSKQDKLSDYEDDYLKRLAQQKIDDAKAAAEAVAAEAAAKVSANKKGGALPKGFEAKAEPEPSKKSKGTLPKGF
nr:trans-sialidase [Nitrosopumilus sp.]